MKSGVIVIGDHVQALGIVRSLGKRGVPVYLVNNRRICITRFSRYLKKFIKCPDFTDNRIINFLINLAKKERVDDWILMPTNDAAVYVLSRYKDALEEHFKVPTPSWDIVKYAYNKKLTYKLAERIGIPIPKTIYPENTEDLRGIDLNFPAIIKPATMHLFYKKTKTKVFKVNNKKELIEAYLKASRVIDPSEILVQEVIPGGPEFLYSFCSFYKNGEIIGMFMGKRSRQKPMDFGKSSTYVESVFIRELIEPSKRFLDAINYYGLSEIEFKMDPRDGKFKLLEMNARTWLWHSLAIRCGVDFPYLIYKDLNGGNVKPVKTYRKNVKFIHIYTDLSVVIPLLLRGKMSLREYITSLKGEKEFAVLSKDDPLPFIAETLTLPYLWVVR